MKTSWIITIAAILVALFFWYKGVQCGKTLNDITRDRGQEIETLRIQIQEEKDRLVDLTKEKIKLEKSYLDEIEEYKRIIASKGTQRVYIERRDTVYTPILWTMIDTVGAIRTPDKVIVGDIFKYQDEWSKFRVYSDGFLMNMDYEVRDSIEFNLTEVDEGWYIKGRSLNPATTVTGLDKLVKREYPMTSLWGYTTLGINDKFDLFTGVGFSPEFQWRNLRIAAYGETQMFADGQLGVQGGLRVGFRLK